MNKRQKLTKSKTRPSHKSHACRTDLRFRRKQTREQREALWKSRGQKVRFFEAQGWLLETKKDRKTYTSGSPVICRKPSFSLSKSMVCGTLGLPKTGKKARKNTKKRTDFRCGFRTKKRGQKTVQGPFSTHWPAVDASMFGREVPWEPALRAR